METPSTKYNKEKGFVFVGIWIKEEDRKNLKYRALKEDKTRQEILAKLISDYLRNEK